VGCGLIAYIICAIIIPNEPYDPYDQRQYGPM
jgi:phage shock protein PspC (stress-responsive transcriptional regulator)